MLILPLHPAVHTLPVCAAVARTELLLSSLFLFAIWHIVTRLITIVPRWRGAPGILHTGIAQHIHSMGSLTNKTFSSHWFIKQFSARYRCRFIPSLLALSLGLSPIKRFLFHWAPRPCPDWRHLNWQFKTNPAK